MKIIALLLGFLTIAIPSPAQVGDGSLHYDFNVILSGIYTPGYTGGESAVEFNSFGGKFWNGALTTPKHPQGFPVRHLWFHTGPLVSGTYADGATFGPGGDFHSYVEQTDHLTCSLDPAQTPCTYDGHFLSAQMTRQDSPVNGTHVYTFSGWTEGTYFDPAVGTLRHVYGYYAQSSDDWNNLFSAQNGQQSWSGGALTVFTGGPQ